MTSKNMKKSVVTGASGFIGRVLVAKLADMGLEVVAVGRSPFPKDGACKYKSIDITESNALEGLLDNNTTIFHLAAHTSIAGSVHDPRNDFKNTLCSLFEVLESARKYDSKVIFPSTASIFDPSNDLPVSEKCYVKPSSPYGAAKAAGEAYCSAYSRCYSLDVRIARMFSVYGVGMKRFAIYDMVRKIENNHEEMSVLGDGNQIRDYLYIDDVVDGLITIAVDGEPGEDYNLASGIPVKISDLAKTIAGIMGYPDIKIVTTGETFPGDVSGCHGDISKIKKLGFKPKVSLNDGLKKTIKWLLNEEE